MDPWANQSDVASYLFRETNTFTFCVPLSLSYTLQAAILYNLKLRHLNEKPYTRTGDIVIAVNPYQWFTDLYTEKKRAHYANRLVWEPSDCDPRGTLDPHVYEVSALSYKGLAFDGQDQSILVSGESGAGKTETVKICLDHVASVQKGHTPEKSLSGELDPVVKLVVDSNPLLEAFGNAKTLRNDNSSRFGKYLQLQFDKDAKGHKSARCGLVGSHTEVYLLEKNRVVGHDSQERNFHIFYQLLAAPDSEKTKFWKGLKGSTNETFRYIGYTDTTGIEGVSDANKFRETLQALEIVGISGNKLEDLMKSLCIVLQLGNLSFSEHHSDSDKSTHADMTELKALAELMELPEQVLSLAFTERTFETRGESHKVPLTSEAAQEACNALAKEAYQKIFLWLVNTVNQATSAVEPGEDKSFGIIGLLDIFGFETFETNRFEQLCINYANEKLQQKFTEDIFRNVQAEYQAEGIDLADIWYDDNTDVLDLIEGRTGLLAMLNEECVRPKGNDQDFVQKALQQNSASPCLVVNKFDRLSFGIHHFAGHVLYDAEMFVSKNLDTLTTDLQSCAEQCSNPIINTGRLDALAGKSGQDGRSAPKRNESNIAAKTVWTKYRTHLTGLMADLRKTRSRYIRCIKPNTQKSPAMLEHNTVVEQLRCAGVIAGITISRSVFPNQLDNRVVLSRYSNIWDRKKYPSKKTDGMTPNQQCAEDCRALMTCALKSKEELQRAHVIKAFAVGKTKTYFRSGALEWLENSRMSGLDTQAATIQSAARGWLIRKQMQESDRRKQRVAAEKQVQEERVSAEKQVQDEQKAAEEQAHLEHVKKEAAARATQRLAEHQILEDEIDRLHRALEQADKVGEEALEAFGERKVQAQRETEQLEKDFEKARTKSLDDPKAQIAKQQMKLEEAKKLIAYLKKDNRKVRGHYEKLLGKANETRDNAKKLIESNRKSGDAFEELDDEAMQIHNKYDALLKTLDTEKSENKRLCKEVRNMQDEYMSTAEARLEMQKIMSKMLTMIQSDCTSPQVVEDTVVIALQCETEAKSIMANLEAMDDLELTDTEVSEFSETPETVETSVY